MGELVDPTHYVIDQNSLICMRIYIFRGELMSEEMDEDEELDLSIAANETPFNALLEISQQNALSF